MKLTPNQIAELRSSTNVRGMTTVAGVMMPVYSVMVTNSTLTRVQQLTAELSMPERMAWHCAYMNPDRVEIYTTRPEWFVELEEMINAARRPVQQQ